MSVPILEVENLTVILRQKKKKKVLVDNLNFKLYEGQCLGILGESGSGKSTLGRVICGMLKPDSGIYTLNDVEIYKSKSNKKILQEKLSIVFQDYTTSTNPRFKIKDIIAEGLFVYKKRTKKNIDLKKEIVHLLEMVGLDETFLNRFPHQLSGGQLQRVCIARAVACQPEVILLDEAISSLDAHTQVQVMDLLKELKEKLNLTYIFITHDLTSITYLCDEVVFLKDGKITESLKVKDLNKTTDEYAKKLIHSIIEF
jgi:nickel transport system ATP-binding protein